LLDRMLAKIEQLGYGWALRTTGLPGPTYKLSVFWNRLPRCLDFCAPTPELAVAAALKTLTNIDEEENLDG